MADLTDRGGICCGVQQSAAELAAGCSSWAPQPCAAEGQTVDREQAEADGDNCGLSADKLQQLAALVDRSQRVMSHAWMIRTFVKHCDEVEDFPELNEMARTIFDVFRAVETQTADPLAYFRTLRKKIGKLKKAAEQFENDAWQASTHTNFQQCSVAGKFLGDQLQELLEQAEAIVPRPAPPTFQLPGGTGIPSPPNAN